MSILGLMAWKGHDCGSSFEIVWHKMKLMPNNYSYEIVY